MYGQTTAREPHEVRHDFLRGPQKPQANNLILFLLSIGLISKKMSKIWDYCILESKRRFWALTKNDDRFFFRDHYSATCIQNQLVNEACELKSFPTPCINCIFY